MDFFASVFLLVLQLYTHLISLHTLLGKYLITNLMKRRPIHFIQHYKNSTKMCY